MASVRGMARSGLWLTVGCAVACFTLITFMRPTNWYARDQEFTYIRGNMTINFPGDVEVLQGTVMKKGKPTVVDLGRNAPLWSGQAAFPVTLQWGSIMAAALATIGLMLLRTDSSSKPSGTSSAYWAAMNRKVRAVAAYQLPPRQLWFWYCGGLSVLDAFLVATWCALVVVYLYYNIQRKFEATSKRFMPTPSPPAPPPTSVSINNITLPALNVSIINVTTPYPGVNITTNITMPPSPTPIDITWEFALRRLENVAKSCGELLRGIMMLVFFPVSRSNFLQWLCGSDFSSLIKYHRWMSWFVVWSAVAHGTLYMTLWGSEASWAEELTSSTTDGQANIAGLLAVITMLIMAATSSTWFRSNFYKLFIRFHVGGFVCALLFTIMHYRGIVNWILPGLILYGLDRAFRYWQLASSWSHISAANMCLDGNIMTISLSWSNTKGVIQPGQSVYLRVPAVSWLEAHPFTVADVLENGDVTRVILHMRVGGSWTSALRQRLLQGEPLRVQVEGPYDSKMDHLQAAPPAVVIIAGGIGVTPVIALLRRYLRAALSGSGHVPQVHFVWTSRSLAELRLMGADLLAAAANTCMSRKGSGSSESDSPTSSGSDHTRRTSWLHATLHYTGQEHELAEHQQALDVLLPEKPAKAGSMVRSMGAALDKQASLASQAAMEQECSSPAKLLAAHPSRNLLVYAVCIVLAFLGAWAGLLCGAYYEGYYARTTQTGVGAYRAGALYFFTVALGAVLPPFLCIALAHLFTRTSPSTTTPTKSPATPSSYTTSVQVLPGYTLVPAAGGAASLQLLRGRPCFNSVLQRIQACCSSLSEVEVLVAGPEAMYLAVLEAAAQLQGCFKAAGPDLVVKQVAHHH